jgi:glycosyltransferase involved in cell wall biosynthesis
MRTKILYLITGLNVGGAEMILWKTIKYLNKKKFNPVVVSIIPPGKIGQKISQEGVKVYSLNIKKFLLPENKDKIYPLFIRSFSVLFREIPRLISIVSSEKPMILHSHLFHANFLGRIIGKICGVPIIISTIHNIDFGGKLREKLLRYTDKFHDVTIAVSQTVADTMVKKGVVSKEKIRIIYNGIEDKKMEIDKNISRKKISKELGISNEKFILISVGRLTKQKGYPYMIDAMQILKQNFDLIWIILGEGEERTNLEKEIQAKNLQKHIFLLGNVENVEEYLNASDIFVMPSLWEGLPLSLLEAMAASLPVIATRVGGIPEVITDGINGFLVAPRSSQELAKKIKYVLNLPSDTREKIVKIARETITHKFSLNKMINEYQKLYQELIEKKIKRKTQIDS